MANAEAATLWLAKTPPDVAKARASLEHIARDGHRASEVIASVRGFLQKGTAEKALVDVNDLILEVLAIERAELQALEVLVEVELAETNPQVLSDRLQLQQVILNLIANAAEAMGPVTDRERVLRVKSEVDRAGDVSMTIEDSGTGIDQDHIARIFEPFFTTRSHGMGLGLWICRTIVETHDGQLTASPGIDHGAVFRIVLPDARAGVE